MQPYCLKWNCSRFERNALIYARCDIPNTALHCSIGYDYIMSRRSSTSAGTERELLATPWPLLLAVAVVAFAILRWLLPAIIPDSPLFVAVEVVVRSSAWVVGAGLLILAGVAWNKQRQDAEIQAKVQARIAEQRAAAQRAEELARAKAAPKVETAHELDAIDFNLTHTGLPEVVKTARSKVWSVDVLARLNQAHIERLASAYFGLRGYRTESSDDPLSGIAVRLYRGKEAEPYALVRCQPWVGTAIAAGALRELHTRMAEQQVRHGLVITAGEFTDEAKAFAKTNRIQLLGGQEFVTKILDLSPDQQEALLDLANDR